MCSGQTVHRINGGPMTLREGELLFLKHASHSVTGQKREMWVNFICAAPVF